MGCSTPRRSFGRAQKDGSMKLYGYWRSPATYRVRLALAWKGLAFEAVPVDLRRGEHRRLTYLNRNPQGLVPLLEEEDGTRVAQSLAILDYLEETRPLPPLLPAGPAERARVRTLAQFLACEVQPLTSLRVRNHLHRALRQ